MMLKIIISIIVIQLLSYPVFAQITLTPGNGYLDKPAGRITTIIKKEGVIEPWQINSLQQGEYVTSHEYVDGFGRKLEEIIANGSPVGKDIIRFHKYDNTGYEVKAYLPFESGFSNATYRPVDAIVTEQADFYLNNTALSKVPYEQSPFAQAKYEESPTGRLLSQGNIGEGFQTDQHYKKTSYRANESADNVRMWNSTGISTGLYLPNELSVMEALDENNNKFILFVDKLGRLILKRQQADQTVNGTVYPYFETYYIYNNAGNIAYVIPPKAVVKMQSAGYNISNAPKLIFYFVYDQKNRLIQKKVPGAEPFYFIYDPLDRLILTQDGKLRTDKKWIYTKYDSRNRPAIQGIYAHTTTVTQQQMQDYVNLQDYTTHYFEERTAGTNSYYSNYCFPINAVEEIMYCYYDDYDFNNDNSPDYSYVAQGLPGEAANTDLTTGMITGVRKKILGTTTWLINITFYDKRLNAIQLLSNNQLNSAVASRTTQVVDFAGKIRETKQHINAGTTSVSVRNTFDYDNMDRLKEVKQSNNGAAEVIVARYEYNVLGKLVDKKLHSTNGGSSFLQSIDLRYNIRGQLTNINNSSLTNDGGITNDESNDVFGMELLYDKNDVALGNVPRFNGQLSAIKWAAKTPIISNPDEKAYLYTYDKLNRLSSASYKAKQYGTSTWTWQVNGFNESMTYDQGGNILTLSRNAVVGGNIQLLDNLTYDYGSAGDDDQLKNVVDNSPNNDPYGFRNFTGSLNGYSYDQNGSLISDAKKGTLIEYNELNKVKKITQTSSGKYIQYMYDAAGVRVSKWTWNGTILNKQEYIDGVVFDATSTVSLSYFNMKEGRVRSDGGTLTYEYFITDHQGNVRLSFEDNGAGQPVVKQETGYYAFGMIMPGGYIPTNPNKKLFNGGNEWQDELGGIVDYYSTFFRQYDPILAKFNEVDSKAELSESWSVYSYASNDPASSNDPLGDKSIADFRTFDDFVRYFLTNGINSIDEFNQEGFIFSIIRGGDGEGFTYLETPVTDVQYDSQGRPYIGVVYFNTPGSYSMIAQYTGQKSGEVRFDYESGVSGGEEAQVVFRLIRLDALFNQGLDYLNTPTAWDYFSTGMSIVGGLLEAGAGVILIETGFGAYAAVDGASRAILGAGKLYSLISKGRKESNVLPGNLGEVVGYTIDNAIDSNRDPNKKGVAQQALGFVNDAVTVVGAPVGLGSVKPVPTVLIWNNAVNSPAYGPASYITYGSYYDTYGPK